LRYDSKSQAYGTNVVYDAAMQRIGERLIYSASDLNDFLECRYLTGLERRAAFGELDRPERSESAALIASKGDEHERRYLEQLRSRYGDALVEFTDRPQSRIDALLQSERATVAAMESGAPVIYQATFFDGVFLGRTDFLHKTDTPCTRWPWSYEVLDTKLAHNPKPYFLIQLCNYSEHLARVQGSLPQHASIIAGSGVEQRFMLQDYVAYYRHLKTRFLEFMEAHQYESERYCTEEARADERAWAQERRVTTPWTKSEPPYPHEVSHCQICRWNPLCEAKRDRDDYLGIVAGMRRDAIRKLQESGIATLATLATAGDEQRPQRFSPETFTKLRAQASLQHSQRTTGEHRYELLPSEPNRGFALLPQPNPADVFFDMEGDPLYTAEHGLEYLFGAYLPLEDRYLGYWAKNSAEEQRAFESFMDFLMARYRRHPNLHVYHYAAYETVALKRLCGRYGSREKDLDALLRARVFVNLYPVVRQSMRISQPSYSIKKIEPFYGFERITRTQRGDDSILMFESWLVSRDDAILADIEAYNRDDCISTLRLRDWLLERRLEAIARDGDLPWLETASKPMDESPTEGDEERATLRATLLAELKPPETLAAFRNTDEPFRARYLLGHLLDYHKRDEKPSWWAYFDRCENRDELVDLDREAIGGLRYRSDIAPYRLNGSRNLVYVYDFPEQQHAIAEGDSPYVLDATEPHGAGTVVRIDEEALQLHLKLSGRVAGPEFVNALAPQPTINSRPIRDALLRVAKLYRDGRLASEHPALYEVLLSRDPRFRRSGASELGTMALSLDNSYLFVQGPPGTGKTTKGAAMIVDLLAAGKRVAIMANAHKAIHNLLHKVEAEASRRGVAFRGLQKYTNSSSSSMYQSQLDQPSILATATNDAFAEPHDLAAGTAWLFSREERIKRYDYLVIDEAGQVSLANAIACAPCADNVILLGDPLQLAQVSQGAHPVGVESSVLEHLLGDDATVPTSRGVFLEESYRMHPEICAFISGQVYAGRLHAAEATRAHAIESPGLTGSGLRYLPVAHDGSSRQSEEEANAIVGEIGQLLRGRFQLNAGVFESLEQQHILVVSPYNAQRRLLRDRLRSAGFNKVRVGTVDSFQGLQAPVVFYSMATSSGDDLPRGVGFLFEKNRFNVAISRAQCMSALVCSPHLLDVNCSTPEQMSLVNLLCRYVEEALEAQVSNT
jgi:predicted RecB family nuclease